MRDHQEPRLCTAIPAARMCIGAAGNGQEILRAEDYSMLEKKNSKNHIKNPAQVKDSAFLPFISAH